MGFLNNLWTNPGPDAGWSWVIAVSSCCIQFQMVWISRFQGFLFTAIIQMFGVSREEATVPFAVYSFGTCFPGIFASMLMQCFSERQIAIGGILVASVGLSMCYFARSILWITVWMGFVAGCSTGITITVLPVLLSHYFVKSRTTANGICLAGRSIGGLVFPPVAFQILNTYGLKGTFLLMGAIVSNSLIGAALLRPRNRMNFPERLTCKDQHEIKYFMEKRRSADVGVNTIPKPDHYSIESEKVDKSLTSVEHLNDNKLVQATAFPILNKESLERLDLSMNPTNPKSPRALKKFTTFMWNCLKIMKDPVYILTVTSEGFIAFSSITLFLLLVDYLMDVGFSKEFSVMVLMVQSVSDLMSRVFTGFITDRGYLSRQAFIAITFLLYGSTFFFLTVFNVTYLCVFNSVLYGFFYGCTLITVVAFYGQHLSKKEMPIGIGLSGIFKGLSFMFQSALVGYFRDQIRSYVPLFYLFSSVALVFSSLWFILALKDKCKNWNSLPVREIENQRK